MCARFSTPFVLCLHVVAVSRADWWWYTSRRADILRAGPGADPVGPEQLVGIEAAKTSAKARIAGVVTKPEEVVLNVENFLMEVSSGSSGSSAETWVDTHLLTLHDSANNVEMVQLSQPVEVPIKYIYAARKETPVRSPKTTPKTTPVPRHSNVAAAKRRAAGGSWTFRHHGVLKLCERSLAL